MTGRSHLVLGGARSGKTRHAMTCAEIQPERIYLATAEAWDDEMRARIQQHQKERDATWSTVEEPLEICQVLKQIDRQKCAIVVDCLTLWLNNLMAADRDVDGATDDVVAAVGRSTSDIIFVSNEIGFGIVPDNALARRFRDAQGRLNQRIARSVDRVDLVVAGLPLNVKPGR
ncbi:MAG: bifunctional adenosylcobinamide kinase/adenosylcobinamide-phosphate guanylyltransferase [Hyphomicrobiaceae bacterium]